MSDLIDRAALAKKLKIAITRLADNPAKDEFGQNYERAFINGLKFALGEAQDAPAVRVEDAA